MKRFACRQIYARPLQAWAVVYAEPAGGCDFSEAEWRLVRVFNTLQDALFDLEQEARECEELGNVVKRVGTGAVPDGFMVGACYWTVQALFAVPISEADEE